MNTKNNNSRLIINQKYFNDLNKFDTLSQDEIKLLYTLIATGNTIAFNTIIQSNLKLVIHFAKQYKNYIKDSFDLDDLISEGNIGLIKSIERFKPEMDIKFSYFASYWIKKYIQDFLMNNKNLIRIPQNKIIAENKIRKEIDILFQQHQIEISDYDLINTNKFLPSSINYFFNKSKTTRLENIEMFIQDETPEDLTDEIKHKISFVLKYLNSQERIVIKMFYGIDFKQRFSSDEIATKFNLSRQRINEIKLNALAKMKTILNTNANTTTITKTKNNIN
jgi:RNA polymerase primary sigma factor